MGEGQKDSCAEEKSTSEGLRLVRNWPTWAACFTPKGHSNVWARTAARGLVWIHGPDTVSHGGLLMSVAPVTTGNNEDRDA